MMRIGQWFKSSFSKGKRVGQLEVRNYSNRKVAVRNSRYPGYMTFCTYGEWNAFIAGVKAGEFDL